EVAEGVPERYRAGYMNLSPHRKALQALKVCSPEVQKLLYVKSAGPDFGNERRYFSGLYQLTASASSATSVEAVVTAIASALPGALARSAVITVQSGSGNVNRVVKAKESEELSRRAEKFIGKTKDRIYLDAMETSPHKPVAWIRLESAACEGGIYVACA